VNALVATLTRQFGRPQGALGWLIGHVMAVKNRERSEWVLAQLGLDRDSDVLEVGFGPGTDIRRAARIGRFVAGIDHSAEMVRQATRRNREAVAQGRVDLREGSAASLPWASDRFDVAFSINALHFSRDLARPLREMRRVVRPGALVAVAVQPLHPGSTEETAREWGLTLEAAFRETGLADVRVEAKALRPVSACCAFGRKRSDGS
jgi:ubiquinone/menaquinone biosynthesis C-methylase UbiE